MKGWRSLILVALTALNPILARANSGDVSGGLAIGSSYAGIDTAPTNGLIVQGNVGIGVTSPVNPLDIYGGIAIGTSYAGVDTAPTDGLIVQGGVGIGTTSAASGSQLTVSRAGNFVAYFESTGSNAADVLIDASAGSQAAQVIFMNGGIEKYAFGNGSTNGLFLFDAAASKNLITNTSGGLFILGAAQNVYIDTSGHVGIGNASPAHMLHVGSSSASGIVMELQNSSGACTYNPGASSVTVSCSSDIRLKSDIQDSKGALSWVDDLRVRDFTVKATGERRTGVVAQEVMIRHPDMVHQDAKGTYLVDEPNPWKLVKAIQEQQDEIDELKRTIARLRDRE